MDTRPQPIGSTCVCIQEQIFLVSEEASISASLRQYSTVALVVKIIVDLGTYSRAQGANSMKKIIISGLLDWLQLQHRQLPPIGGFGTRKRSVEKLTLCSIIKKHASHGANTYGTTRSVRRSTWNGRMPGELSRPPPYYGNHTPGRNVFLDVPLNTIKTFFIPQLVMSSCHMCRYRIA